VNQISTGLDAGSINYSYDERDRLLFENGQSYSWDANGNLTAKAGHVTYGWDAEDRLAGVVLNDGTVTAYTYDADGVRVRTEVTAPDGSITSTEHLLDTSGPLSQVVADTDEAGTLKAYYVSGDDLLAVMRPSGQGSDSRFYQADGLGSIRVLSDEAGEVTDRYAFTAFGEQLGHEGEDPNAYLFAAQQLDPNSGFYYNRARWMDPEMGRFASTDPLIGNTFDPRSLHRYTYANLDPVNTTDPSGKESLLLLRESSVHLSALS
jgi:RHS repeat-associated protein